MQPLFATAFYAAVPSGLGIGLLGTESATYGLILPDGPRPDRFGVYNIGGEVTAPVLTYSEPAVYPERMRETGAQGTVVVTAILGTDGIPAGADVLVPFMRPFDFAAINATNRLRFTPSSLHGIEVPVRIFVEFPFRGSHGPALPTLVRRPNPIEPPAALNSVWVYYPRSARRRRQKGTVKISFTVTTEGRPADLRLIRSVSEELNQSAIRAVSRLRFKPAKMDGRPVPAQITIEIHFIIY